MSHRPLCPSWHLLRPVSRRYWIALWLILQGALTGCGAESSSELELRIVNAAGERPSSLVVIARREGAPPLRVVCGQEQQVSAELGCSSTGITLRSDLGSVSLLIKARGNRYTELQLETSDGGSRSVTLSPLSKPEQTANYVTGLPAGSSAVFLSMAVSADTDLGPAHVVKFYLIDPHEGPDSDSVLYLLNTRKHMLHFEFTKSVLGLSKTMEEFEAETYHGAPRDAFAGTLIWYPQVSVVSASLSALAQDGPHEAQSPLILTFMPRDDLNPAQALHVHRIIEERLGFLSLSGSKTRLMYLPAGVAQEQALKAEKGIFEAGDAGWLSREELYGETKQQLLNPGVAFGRLRVLKPEALAKTVVSYTDILLLPRLPNKLPIVGGTISEELQTPLAHVNVAARTRGTPNMALIGAQQDPRIVPLINKMVRFEVGKGTFKLREATLAEAQVFWKQQHKPPFSPSHDDSEHGLPLLSEIGFNAASFVGVKAANLAELHQLLGKEAPTGFAIPFADYDHFMAHQLVSAAGCKAAELDCVQEGRLPDVCAKALTLCLPSEGTETLWQHVDRQLEEPDFVADAVLREACLDGLRYLMKHGEVEPVFAAKLDARVAEVFADAKVRLRSSTNAEDLENFSGAGLYRSVGAWAKGKKRASARVREVWASVWSHAAFEERGFWNIDHRAVRMGVAVNQAFVDEEANGVLITRNLADPFVVGMYVNVQLGEASVTNPEDGAVAEVFSIIPAPSGGVQVARQRYSSLSPGVPVLSEAEVWALFLAATKVQQHFAGLYEVDPFALTLDMEFKLVAKTRDLIIKQVRPYAEGDG